MQGLKRHCHQLRPRCFIGRAVEGYQLTKPNPAVRTYCRPQIEFFRETVRVLLNPLEARRRRLKLGRQALHPAGSPANNSPSSWATLLIDPGLRRTRELSGYVNWVWLVGMFLAGTPQGSSWHGSNPLRWSGNLGCLAGRPGLGLRCGRRRVATVRARARARPSRDRARGFAAVLRCAARPAHRTTPLHRHR
jgi:hypothetical protein